jgi:zinc protease
VRNTVAAGLLLAVTTGPGWALPKVQKVVSPSGVAAWLVELHDAPLITFRIAFKGGIFQDPPGKFGTTSLTSYLFDEGAGPYDSAELRRRLTRISATLGGASSYEYFSISFATPSAYKAEAFELLRLAINEPHFDAEPIERGRIYYLNNIEAAQKSPPYVAAQALRERIFGKHPLGTPWSVQKAGYQSVVRADIEAYRHRMLARDNVKIAVVGDIDAATLAPLLDKLFGTLPTKAGLQPFTKPAGAPGSCQVTAMDVPQAVVQFATVTPRLTWRQQISWWVLQAIMNEGISAGRLSHELREKRGLVYGIGTDYTDYTAFGMFSGAFAAKMADVPEALQITRSELARMVDKGPTDEELATVKPAIVGRTLIGLDTGAAIANTILAVQLNDQPASYLDDIGGTIESITRQEVWDVAKILLDPKRLAVSIVGKPTQADACGTAVARAK